jgi:hypothetical protein
MADFAITGASKTCAVCGRPFAPGEVLTSFLLDDVTASVRIDMHSAEAAAWQPPRLVLCRWNHLVKERPETPAKAAKSAAAEMEEMLLSLAAEEAPEGGNSRAVLRHLLVLALARRRILKEVKDSPGTWLHVKSGEIIRAPEPEGMTRQDLMAAAMKLSARA